jgi:hypothetical protein
VELLELLTTEAVAAVVVVQALGVLVARVS